MAPLIEKGPAKMRTSYPMSFKVTRPLPVTETEFFNQENRGFTYYQLAYFSITALSGKASISPLIDPRLLPNISSPALSFGAPHEYANAESIQMVFNKPVRTLSFYQCSLTPTQVKLFNNTTLLGSRDITTNGAFIAKLEVFSYAAPITHLIMTHPSVDVTSIVVDQVIMSY